ncbi:MAG: hypothetical protein H7X99_04065 [Saprospiraceae bacterium]|nr:hypothetical protein [Saprospiraceae bacterium]
MVIFLLAGNTKTLCQSLTIDYKTLSINSGEKKYFKVGEFISVKIAHYDIDTSDKFVVEITGEQYENTSGIDAFKKMTKVDKENLTSGDEYFLLSLQIPDKDKSIIKITRFKPDGKTKLEERSYFFRNRGGLKFDVSSGFFVTNLRDEVYVLKYIDTVSKQIIRDDNGKTRLGIGLLAHLHCRSQKWLSGGLTGGFEINNDSKVGFLGGASLFFGYDKKFVLSVGAAFSKIKTISNLYKVDEIVPSTVSVVPTVDIWKMGWFTSMTYNF